jgi:uncharacterized protein (UPF0276 family)
MALVGCGLDLDLVPTWVTAVNHGGVDHVANLSGDASQDLVGQLTTTHLSELSEVA